MGSTAHIDGRKDVDGWKDGDNEHNAGLLALHEYEHVRHFFPEIDGLQLSGESSTIIDDAGAPNDPGQSKVFYRTRDEVRAIGKVKGESPGHHPHPLALGGPPGQHLTVTGDTLRYKHPMHVKVTSLHNKIIKIIKQSNERHY